MIMVSESVGVKQTDVGEDVKCCLENTKTEGDGRYD
jgi:hypothetical protein